MIDYLAPHIGTFVTGLIALILGWLGKSQVQKNVDKADLTLKIQAVYKEMVADADKNMDIMRDEIRLLKERQLMQDEKWLKKLDDIEKSWQTKYSRLQARYNSLQKKLEDYENKPK
jgi:hypothetical protein